MRRSWTAIKSDHARHGLSRELTDRIQTLVNKAGVSFYFHMLSLVASRGLAANRQLFYLTMVFRHKGTVQDWTCFVECHESWVVSTVF